MDTKPLTVIEARCIVTTDWLADGTHLFRVYFGPSHVTATGIGDDGRIVRRRYRNDQLVKIEAR